MHDPPLHARALLNFSLPELASQSADIFDTDAFHERIRGLAQTRLPQMVRGVRCAIQHAQTCQAVAMVGTAPLLMAST